MAKMRRVIYRGRRPRKFMGRKRRGTPRSTGSLKRRLRKVERAVRETSQVVQMKQTVSGLALEQPYGWLRLTQYNGMTPTFGTLAPDLFNKPKAFHRKVGIDLVLSAGNEADLIDYTIFVVSLKKSMTPYWTQSTGALVLTQDIHYSFLDGMVMVNKEFFNIHKIKRTATGVTPSLPQPIGGINTGGLALNANTDTFVRKRWYWKQNIGKRLTNYIGDFRDLVQNPQITSNYFILMFNNNLGIDFEWPRVSCNMIHTFLTSS